MTVKNATIGFIIKRIARNEKNSRDSMMITATCPSELRIAADVPDIIALLILCGSVFLI